MNNLEKLDEFYDWMKSIIETNGLYKDQFATKEPPIFIVCMNHDEYRRLGYMNSDKRSNYRFIYGANDLRGISNPKVEFVGNWLYRTDINDIIMQVKIATR